MQGSLLADLQRRRFPIRTRWDILLRTEPVTSPLAHPDALVHLINTTLDEILGALKHRPAGQTCASHHALREKTHCLCGRNPWLAYFAAGAQAMREGLILAQASMAPCDPAERDAALAELNAVLDEIARREIESFCGVCQYRDALIVQPCHALAVT